MMKFPLFKPLLLVVLAHSFAPTLALPLTITNVGPPSLVPRAQTCTNAPGEVAGT